MSLADVRAELEEDRTWRIGEIVSLRNKLGDMSEQDERDRFRRCIVVMLYAHFEGFCKFALVRYVRGVNEAGLTCERATSAILAASWREVFKDLAIPDRRSVLGKDLPDDKELQHLAKQVEFAGRIRELLQLPLKLDDTAVNTESNLTASVLKKNLFRVGIDHSTCEPWTPQIGQLVGRRNDIAHGQDRAGVTSSQYEAVERAAFSVMERVMELVMDALTRRHYLVSPAA